MRGVIRCVIAVQEVKLHATDLNLPGAQPDRVPRQGDLQPQPFAVRLAQRRDRQLSGVVVREERLLCAVLIDHLAKIALLVEQPNADDGNAQIAGSLELIAGNIAQPARINGQGFAQHEFHTEIRNRAKLRLRVGLLKPAGRLRRLSPGLHQVVHVLAESGVGQHMPQFLPRDRLQDDPGVIRELPQHGIQLPPHLVGGMIPCPAHIQCKLGQGIESLYVRG
ncbi:MAG: hypothetical protein H6R11_953 [Proteobacteria bacterium]|nr:hypothetical protein [Pseudomonadota bacterium]